MTRRHLMYVVGFVTAFAVILGGTIAYRIGSGILSVDRNQASPTGIATAHLEGSGPGSLISASTTPGLTADVPQDRVQSARIVYRSTEGDTGAASEVSGMVFAPKGSPPDGGWPVIAFAHGSTGIDEPCAPSLSADLVGQGPVISAWVEGGYAVAFPDYQGLGAPGIHPYLDSRTAGLNLIDAVRALRATFPGVSTKWAGYGPSQGGGAVWAANEQASTYAPDLALAGTVAIAPSTNPAGLLDKAEAGTLTRSQAPVFAWLLTSVGRLHPEVNLDDFRRGTAAQYWQAISACTGRLVSTRDQAWNQLTSADLAPANPQAAQRLRDLLVGWTLPQRPLSAPLSVVYGGKDPFIDVAWVDEAIQRACALGGTVVWRLEENSGHEDFDTANEVHWLADRFAGAPVFNYCR